MRLKPVRVDEHTYHRLRGIARDEGRPIAAVIREAMERYATRERTAAGKSILDLEPHDCGPLTEWWTREAIRDEMLERCVDSGRD
ncbi:MAG: ribbon-helix-helix protein, CopG family [Acidobacteria bacterium]|nr:ribbon-helix-helix protein, CopG family [Acidobacteriota bacterium]MCG3191923.1 hypothetical protein [Thermoanaerobaculia bacterium]MCK6681824.1 hypothetical protein [Thermoanaerobaculia bacterium]